MLAFFPRKNLKNFGKGKNLKKKVCKKSPEEIPEKSGKKSSILAFFFEKSSFFRQNLKKHTSVEWCRLVS